jgi:hypothetical protein
LRAPSTNLTEGEAIERHLHHVLGFGTGD